MTHAEVERLLRAIHRAWPTVPNHAPIDADTIRVWQVILSDVPHDAGEAVVVNRARSGDRFPPTPGVIAGEYHTLVDRAAGDAVPDADQAWLEVHSMVQARGWYSGPPERWSHPAVAAIATAMTWNELCHGEMMVVRAHFIRTWPAIAARFTAARVAEQTMVALGEVAPMPRRELR